MKKYMKFSVALKLYQRQYFRTPKKGTSTHFLQWFKKESSIGSIYIPKGKVLQPEGTCWETIETLMQDN